MKAKNYPHPSTETRRRRAMQEEPLPHELGRHLFAMIRRNLMARAQPAPEQAKQLFFAL